MEDVRNIFSLDGKTALVTGGSRGLGLSIAKGLSGFGAAVVIAARDPGRLEAARAGLESAGGSASCSRLDLSEPAAAAEEFENIYARAGGIDILVNNAGINIRAPLMEAPEEDFDRIFSVNLKSIFLISRAFAKKQLEGGKQGKIINITSILAERVRPGIGIYSASKGGLTQLTKAFAVEFGSSGINTNAIGPGYYKTPMNEPLAKNAEFDAWVREKTPAGRWGEPDELIGAAVFLASEASNYVNGQTIYVDGGWLSKL